MSLALLGVSGVTIVSDTPPITAVFTVTPSPQKTQVNGVDVLVDEQKVVVTTIVSGGFALAGPVNTTFVAEGSKLLTGGKQIMRLGESTDFIEATLENPNTGAKLEVKFKGKITVTPQIKVKGN